MSATLINLIIQIIAGALGGNGAGNALKDLNLGPLGNTIAGAIGGVAGGQLLSALIPALAGAAGTTDVGALVGQAVGGGISGAILTAIVGFIKSKMAPRSQGTLRCPCALQPGRAVGGVQPSIHRAALLPLDADEA